MTPTELRACLETLGWSQRRLAEEIGCNERTARRMADGSISVAEPVERWLQRMLTWQAKRPEPPTDWQRR